MSFFGQCQILEVAKHLCANHFMHFVPKTASGIFFGIAFVFEEPKQREIETERGREIDGQIRC